MLYYKFDSTMYSVDIVNCVFFYTLNKTEQTFCVSTKVQDMIKYMKKIYDFNNIHM